MAAASSIRETAHRGFSIVAVARRILMVMAVTILPISDRVAAAEASRLLIDVSDEDGLRIPCRVHLLDDQGRAQRAADLPFWNDHFVCSGHVELALSQGTYRYSIERGPEYSRAEGQVVVPLGGTAKLMAQLKRIANLRNEGWFSADLHVHRPPKEIEQLMLAEDLDFAPVITWWNARNLWADREIPVPVVRQFDKGRFYSVMAGEDERGGGALLFFRLKQPLRISRATREEPSPLHFVELARRESPQAWIDIEKPFWWDVPTWLASGMANSIGLANNHMNRSGMLINEAWGRPRDVKRLPNPLGNGYWTQEIYYHALNSGIRIPPSAGSASGVLANPVGYNRVYAYVGGPLTPERWWNGLAAGRCFVTNGPLLICRANGELPGSVFRISGPTRLQLQIELTALDSVPAIEVIRNGTVIERLPCKPQTDQSVSCEVEFSESGWFLVRAITNNAETFRFASTGPFYVQNNVNPTRISRSSVQFFLDWVDQRIAILEGQLPQGDRGAAVLSYHRRAREFWTARLGEAQAP